MAADVHDLSSIRTQLLGLLTQTGGEAIVEPLEAGAGLSIRMTDDPGHLIAISDDHAQSLRNGTHGSREDYLLSLFLDPHLYWVDQVYVPLELNLRQVKDARGDALISPHLAGLLQAISHEAALATTPIQDLLGTLATERKLVLTGGPGSGKSTTLVRALRDQVRAAFRCETEPIPFHVDLGLCDNSLDPETLLVEQWADVGFGELDVLVALQSGSLWLFLDGVNEVPASTSERALAEWARLFSRSPATTVIASCRDREYEPILDMKRVEIQPLDRNRQLEILNRTIGATKANLVSTRFEHETRYWQLATTPHAIAVLGVLSTYGANAAEIDVPNVLDEYLNALTSRAFRAFGREAARSASLWLEELAWQMQVSGNLAAVRISGDADDSHITIEIENWHSSLSSNAFESAVSGGILRETGSIVRFEHHSLQEAWVGRRIAQANDAGTSAALRLVPAIDVPIRSGMARDSLVPWEPLAPSRFGWEEAIRAASHLTVAPNELAMHLIAINPILAATACASPRVDATTKRMVGTSLVDTFRPEVDLRVRLAADLALEEAIDPRFYTPDGVPAYPLARVLTDASGPIQVGRYPVTNSLYGRFIRDGGYEDESLWTDQGREWLEDGLVEGGAVDGMLRQRRRLIEGGRALPVWAAELGWGPETLRFWTGMTETDEGQARRQLEARFRRRSPKSGAYSDDAILGRQQLPVVGVTFFEAIAFAEWASIQFATDLHVQTKSVWLDASKCVASDDPYPWGTQLIQDAANLVESHVLRPTTPGVFPRDAGPNGIHDLVGNVREWTSSVEPTTSQRFVVGGAWSRSLGAASRLREDSFAPDFWDYNLGVRLASIAAEEVN